MSQSSENAAPPFTADLSVDELLLLADAGWEPLQIVCGDCTHKYTDQATSHKRSKELTWITEALADGQTKALERMRDRAAQAGGHGVVGVRLEALEEEGLRLSSGQHFSALGTAVRRPGARVEEGAQPFTTHLSGQDTWALLEAGHRPLGVVFGFSVYHCRTERRGARDFSEMTALTDALYSARELAMSRMQSQAGALRADGVVGVSIDMKTTYGPTVIFTGIGTAIARPKKPRAVVRPQMAVGLTG
ncbi:MAG: hypothetical protein QOE11_1814 [Solirubrobacteraceae bacterium]|jgi:uncharacterized protein YbjQ (UPF0145 family)|nr:hypothetical protein [Solirubrobacteraceae bacterium]